MIKKLFCAGLVPLVLFLAAGCEEPGMRVPKPPTGPPMIPDDPSDDDQPGDIEIAPGFVVKNARERDAVDIPVPTAGVELIRDVRIVEAPTTERLQVSSDNQPPIQQIPRYNIEVLKVPSEYGLREYWFEFEGGSVVKIGDPISLTSCDEHQAFLRQLIDWLSSQGFAGASLLSLIRSCTPVALSIAQEMIVSCTPKDHPSHAALRRSLKEMNLTLPQFYHRLSVMGAADAGVSTWGLTDSYADWEYAYRYAISLVWGDVAREHPAFPFTCVVAAVPAQEPLPELDEPDPEPEPCNVARLRPSYDSCWEPVAEVHYDGPDVAAGDPIEVGSITPTQVAASAYHPNPSAPAQAKVNTCISHVKNARPGCGT